MNYFLNYAKLYIMGMKEKKFNIDLLVQLNAFNGRIPFYKLILIDTHTTVAKKKSLTKIFEKKRRKEKWNAFNKTQSSFNEVVWIWFSCIIWKHFSK